MFLKSQVKATYKAWLKVAIGEERWAREDWWRKSPGELKGGRPLTIRLTLPVEGWGQTTWLPEKQQIQGTHVTTQWQGWKLCYLSGSRCSRRPGQPQSGEIQMILHSFKRALMFWRTQEACAAECGWECGPWTSQTVASPCQTRQINNHTHWRRSPGGKSVKIMLVSICWIRMPRWHLGFVRSQLSEPDTSS